MRNLKKVLSLALAMVMLLGMMVVGAGAAVTDYKDYDDIDNTVAVAVLSEIGVMQGTGSNFNPKTELNRIEGAAIIYRLVTGGLVKQPSGKSGFYDVDDVPDYSWGAGLVAACRDMGIINGEGGGRFNPGGKLTTAAFAKMLLVALGYDTGYAGYTGGSWETNVARDARTRNILLNGLTMSDNLTREQAAEMAFKTLSAECVEYAGTNISAGGITINSPATVRRHTGSTANVNNVTYDRKPIESNITPIRFCEERFSDLKLNNSGAQDEFGRNYNVWTWKNVDIDGSDELVTPDAEFWKGEGAGAITDKIGSAKGDKNTPVYVNGLVTYRTVDAGVLASLTEKGRLVQVYLKNSDHLTIQKVVVIDTFVGRIASVNKTAGTVTLATYTNRIPGTLNNKYESETLALDEKVAYTAAYNYDSGKYDLQEVNVLTNPVTGVVSSWRGTNVVTTSDVGKSNNDFTVAGTKYEYNWKNVILKGDGEEATDGVATFSVDKTEVNVYLDKYGYALLVDGVEAEKNYAVVIGTGSTNPYGDATNGATLLLPDGTTKTVTAEFIDAAANWTSIGGDTNNQVWDGNGDLVTYTVKSDGTYRLTLAGANAKFKTNYADYANEISFINGKSDFALTDLQASGAAAVSPVDANLYTTSNTIFMVYVGDQSRTGSHSYAVYTGYNNMPSIDNTVASIGVSYKTNSRYSNQIDVVYIAVPSLAGITGADTYFVKKADATIYTESMNGETVRYYKLPAIVNGEQVEVMVDASATIQNKDNSGSNTSKTTLSQSMTGLFAITNVVKDKNDIITSFTDVTNVGTTLNSGTFDWSGSTTRTTSGTTGTVSKVGDTVGIGWSGSGNPSNWRAFNSSSKVFYVNKNYSSIDDIGVDNVTNDNNDLVYAVSDGATSGQKKLKTMIIVEKDPSTPTPPSAGHPNGNVGGERLGAEASLTKLQDALDAGNVTIVEGYDLPNNIIIRKNTKLGVQGDLNLSNKTITFEDGAKLIVEGKLSGINQNFGALTNIEANEVEIITDTSLTGNMYVWKELAVGVTGSVTRLTVGKNGELTVDGTVKGIASAEKNIINVDGTMKLTGTRLTAGTTVVNKVTINVTSVDSLHITGDVAANVTIIAGDGTAAKNGRVNIQGTMLGTFEDKNVKTSTVTPPTQVITSLDGAAKVTMSRDAKLSTGVFKPAAIDLKEGATITLEKGTTNSNITVADPNGSAVSTGTAETTIVIGSDTTDKDAVTTSTAASTESTAPIAVKAAVVTGATDWDTAVNAGFKPVRPLQSGTRAGKAPLWADFSQTDGSAKETAIGSIPADETANYDGTHGPETMPWLLLKVDVKSALAAGTKIKAVVTKGSATVGEYEATFTGGLAVDETKTFHWDMISGTSDNASPKLDRTAENVAGDYTITVTWTVNGSYPVSQTALTADATCPAAS